MDERTMSPEETVSDTDGSSARTGSRRNDRPRTSPRVWMRRALRALAPVAALVTALAPKTAEAQPKTMYLDRLYMAGAPDDAIGMWRPVMGEKTRFFGQLGVGFAYNPFRIENFVQSASARGYLTGAPLRIQTITYFNAGIELLNRFSLQFSLPVIVGQTGGMEGPTSSVLSQVPAPSVAAAMDLRIDGRAIVFTNDARTFKLGIDGSIWVPTGNTISFAGDGSVSGMLNLGLEYDLKKIFFVFNTGPQFRTINGINDFRSNHEWRYAVGAFVPLRDGAVRLGAQIFGSVGFGDVGDYYKPLVPLEWLADARFLLDKNKRFYVGAGGGTRLTPGYSPDFRVVALAGYSFSVSDTHPPSPGKRFKADRWAEHGADTDHDGIPDDVDLCPNDPEDHKPPNTDDGCSALPDRDGDGIPDINDKCPDQPEDFDKIDDADGCPEDDADKDDIADAEDACPKEPGEPSPEPAKNGCPQFIRRISGGSEIQILKQVQFATGKATILQNSYAILDEVVRLLKVNPEITHLDIEGHTDNRGSDELNEKLSDDRAHSVMKYLVDHGIDANRLAAQGFGPRRPIADNNTAAGRQKNRRVEFHIRNQKAEEGGGGDEGGAQEIP